MRGFARRLATEEDRDPVVPPLPDATVVAVPGRGETFVRRENGRGDGPPVVLLHGWALSADLNWFGGIYGVAADHGPVLAPDFHGRGLRSDKRFALELLADDTAALVEHLGLGPVVLVGYSMGGSVSLLMWRHHRHLVAGMVLISTALQWRNTVRERAVWSSMAAVEYGLRLGASEGGTADRYLRMAVEQSAELDEYRSWVKAEIRRGDPGDIAAGFALGLAGAYGYTRARFRRTTSGALVVADPPPTGSPEFARMVEGVTGAVVRPGNRVRILRNGAQTFPAMLEAIASARRTIDFSSYIYWPGEITDRFTDAFVERAAPTSRCASSSTATGRPSSTATTSTAWSAGACAWPSSDRPSGTPCSGRTTACTAGCSSWTGGSASPAASASPTCGLEVADEIDLRRWRSRPPAQRVQELVGEVARQSF